MNVRNLSAAALAFGIIIGACHIEPVSSKLSEALGISAVAAGNALFALAAAALALIVLILRGKISYVCQRPVFQAETLGAPVLSGVLGALLLFSGGYDIASALFPENGPVSIALFLTGLLAVFAGIYFLLAIYLHRIGRQHYGGITLISLFPSVWMIATILTTFMELTTKADIDHYYVDIASMLAILLFLYSCSKALAGMGSGFVMLLSGELAILLSVGAAPANLIANFADKSRFLSNLIYLAIGIYAAFVLPTIVEINKRRAVLRGDDGAENGEVSAEISEDSGEDGAEDASDDGARGEL